MAELNEKFTANISRQSIFQTFYEPVLDKSDSYLKKRSKLVCRNNSDLFFANENLVRACTINPYSSNFRLLENINGNFKIKSLEMNTSRTLLALLGDEDLVVLSLPNSINNNDDSVIPTKSYKIENIGGSIVKVVWQAVATNDCCIVVLNDKSEIKLYDLSISTSIAQIQMKLKESDIFKNEVAVSMSFGSRKNVSGALTLYVASSSGNIYSVFPFIHKYSSLSVSKSSLNKFIKESQHLIRTIEEENSETDTENLKTSPLRRSLIKQYEYITYLGKQLDSNLKPRVEMRNVFSEFPEELYIVNQNLPDSFTPCLQGPVCKTENAIEELVELISNDSISMLASLSLNPTSEPVLTYFAQFKPLIMKWKDETDTMENEVQSNFKNKKEPPALKHHTPKSGYSKPAKGFGFIDLSGEQSSDEDLQITNMKIPRKSYNDDKDYWNENFTSLTTLAAEIISVTTKKEDIQLNVLNINESKLGIIIGGKAIICNTSKWVKDIISSINVGTASSDDTVESEFKLASDGESVNSVAYVQDKISNTGEYLVILRSKKESNLDICQISNNFNITNDIYLEDQLGDYSEKYESILKKEPFEELESEFSSVKNFKHTSLLKSIDSSKINDATVSSTDILKNINILSINTINEVSKFTKFTLHLNFRVLTQIDELRSQVESVSKLQNEQMDKELLTSIDLKIKNLITRQEELDTKTKKIQEKLVDSIQKIMYSRTLPLSTAEKKWFNEINSINSQLTQDTKEKDSLIKVMKNLELQVGLLSQDSKTFTNSENESLDVRLNQHQLHRNLNKLKSWLVQEGRLIEATKSKLEENIKRLQI